MDNVLKGAWVEIENQVLAAGERAPQVPDDTKKTPLMMWTRGFLMEESASLGDVVTVRTLAGRLVEGKLVDVNPRYVHDFGNSVLELLETGVDLREDLSDI